MDLDGGDPGAEGAGPVPGALPSKTATTLYRIVQEALTNVAKYARASQVKVRLREIDGDAELYVICHAGGRSLKVSHYLARNGFEPINVNGGMLAWAGSGRAVVTDDGAPGAV